MPSPSGEAMRLLTAIDSGAYDTAIAAVLIIVCVTLLVRLLEGGES